MVKFYYYYFLILFMPMYPPNKSPSITQNIETYTLNLYVIPHQSCANVLVSEQIKHVNSQLPKASNQLKKSNIRSCVQNFKLTDEINHKFLGQPKFKDNMNMHFFFFSKTRQVCVNVSLLPPNLNHTLSPMYVQN
jgi:hypothetical protein